MSDAPAQAPQDVPATENAPAAVVEDPGFKVFAGNLAYSTTDDGLKTFFAPVQDEIITAQVILRGRRSAGYGFVALRTEDAAKKAVELLDTQELDGRKVIVEIAKPAEQKDKEMKEKKAKRRAGRRAPNKAVPGEVTDAEANGEAKADGVADGAAAGNDADKPKKKKKKASRKPKRKAAEGAEGEATATEGATTEGEARKPRARKQRTPRTKREPGEEPAGEPSKTMVFVANLGFSIEDDGLSALFTEAGLNVVTARIVRRRWGKPRKSKGYGFVDVGSEEEQQKAIEVLQGKEVGGRAIAVKVAVNTPQEEEEERNEDADVDADADADADAAVVEEKPVEAAPATA
ncbi:hypothetical protein CONPUDRAFT_81738 [Coniophora puteana RWD-64-598 SS2]|uniref:RRM domain-containing protein n=1 Tax=Coniophora puteana (strain RWD-64-598) TaxID=741705 RepID=A0A5M3MUD1_CONPW|nr:uncharacterized protein CONPUDRAFT_81738 [Coniophora puteana RWD-64-598 SS2]EIW82201.1 hypothetical protein CONPUDRAFT_81738 [Coniophora puteana RWD-64-598 SS2]